MTTLEYWIKAYPDAWDLARGDIQCFFEILASYEIIAWDDVPELVKACTPAAKPLTAEEIAKMEEAVAILKGKEWREPMGKEKLEAWQKEARDIIAESQRPYIVQQFYLAMQAIWEWIKTTLGDILREVARGLEYLWQGIKTEFQAGVEQDWRRVYDLANKMLLSIGEVTPEVAPELAVKFTAMALTSGLAAHLASVGVETLYPTKNLGVGQIAGLIAEFASFGPLSAATLGNVYYAALNQPMRYAVNAVTRSRLPDEFMLQQMVFEGVLTEAEMKETLAYYGYSDTWIERYLPTMRPDPRYFELSMMCEDEAATDPWIQNRVLELGYEADVNPIMVKGLKKRAIRTQRLDYYSKAFALYKEGYITKDYFVKVLDELEFRPEAKTFAIKAASLAYLYDVTTDQVKYWTDSYLKDLISSDELRLHLSLLGLVPERVWLHGQLARVRKYKKPAVTIKRELEPAMTKVQSTYSQGYVQLYRKGFIDEATLEADLIAIGIDPDLAEATVFLEVTRSAK